MGDAGACVVSESGVLFENVERGWVTMALGEAG